MKLCRSRRALFVSLFVSLLGSACGDPALENSSDAASDVMRGEGADAIGAVQESASDASAFGADAAWSSPDAEGSPERGSDERGLSMDAQSAQDVFGEVKEDAGDEGPEVAQPPLDLGPSAFEQASGLLDPAVLHEVHLHLSEAQLTSLSESPNDWVTPTLTIDGELCHSVALRLHGQLGNFRDLDHGAGLTFNFAQGKKGSHFKGLSGLALNNLGDDPSLVKELLANALFRAANIPAPRVAYTALWVNDQPYGVYVMVEPTSSDAFLSHWFQGEHQGEHYLGDKGRDLFVDSVWRFRAGPSTDPYKNSLFGLVQALDWIGPEDDVSAELEAIFGLERLHAFIATELAIGHQDGYTWSQKGYSLYRATQSSPWVLMPVSAERTFEEHLAPLEGDGRVHALCVGDFACRQALGEAYQGVLDRVESLDLAGMAQGAHALLAEALLSDPRPALAPEATSAALEAVLSFLAERPTTLSDGLACLDPEFGDNDGDGVSSCFDEDCNDDDPLIYPGAVEVCNFKDDDCDSEIDETDEGQENCPTCETVLVDGAGSVLLCRVAKNYEDAYQSCLSRGADLVSIHSLEEQQAIAEAAYADYSGHLWIGLNDRIEEGTFAWTDGSPLDFEHWAGNEPNDWGSGEDCAHLYDGGEHRWNDLPCGHEAGYLCRVPDLSFP